MNDLRVIELNGKFLVSSRDVAKMVDKPHNDLMKSIRQYCEYLTAGEISLSDFFIKSTYTDSTGRTLPCYYITRKGCDMIANKMTGQKGVLFTAAYVTKFEEMERRIANNLPHDYLSALKALVSSEERKQALLLETAQQRQIIGELKPKATYVDSILNNPGLVTITQIAKDYGMSGQEMNKILHKFGVQYNQSGQWLLYKEHHGNGYTHSRTVDIQHKDGSKGVKMNTAWTQKGRLFIYNLLKKNGIVPNIEKVDKPKNNKGGLKNCPES